MSVGNGIDRSETSGVDHDRAAEVLHRVRHLVGDVIFARAFLGQVETSGIANEERGSDPR